MWAFWLLGLGVRAVAEMTFVVRNSSARMGLLEALPIGLPKERRIGLPEELRLREALHIELRAGLREAQHYLTWLFVY